LRKEVIGNATLYLGDCREILPTLSGIDVVVTDPPFGIADAPITHTDIAKGRRGNRDGTVNTWHAASDWDAELDPAWLPLALEIGPVALFGQRRKRTAFEAVADMEPRAEIIWAKDCHTGAPCPVAPRDERIWVFSRAGIKPTRFETSVWDEPVIPTWKHKEHKNEKPVALMVRLVTWLPGETVLDPFMGSGTTGVACMVAERKFVGIELNPEHFAVACRRIEDAQRQSRMFA
jgi:DNA modification methylase